MILILMYFLRIKLYNTLSSQKMLLSLLFFMGGDYPNGQYWPLDSILEFPRMCLGSLSYCMESCSLDILGLLGAKVVSSFLSPCVQGLWGFAELFGLGLTYKYSDLKILTFLSCKYRQRDTLMRIK